MHTPAMDVSYFSASSSDTNFNKVSMPKVHAQMNRAWGGINKFVKNLAKAKNKRQGQYYANV
jgi:superoxide dismutase